MGGPHDARFSRHSLEGGDLLPRTSNCSMHGVLPLGARAVLRPAEGQPKAGLKPANVTSRLRDRNQETSIAEITLLGHGFSL